MERLYLRQKKHGNNGKNPNRTHRHNRVVRSICRRAVAAQRSRRLARPWQRNIYSPSPPPLHPPKNSNKTNDYFPSLIPQPYSSSQSRHPFRLSARTDSTAVALITAPIATAKKRRKASLSIQKKKYRSGDYSPSLIIWPHSSLSLTPLLSSHLSPNFLTLI